MYLNIFVKVPTVYILKTDKDNLAMITSQFQNITLCVQYSSLK